MEANTIKPLRLSASIILPLADIDSDCMKILMLVRKPHMSFENSLVFPGGVCDKQDEAFSNLFPEFAKITAIRELVEETGVLVIPPNINLQNLSSLREQYTNRKFQQINNLILKVWKDHLDLMVPIARFVTPQIPKMSRFDCIFYLPAPGVAKVNLGNIGSIEQLAIHVQQSVKYFWATPQEYIQMMKEGKVFLPPPQNIILNFLAIIGKDYIKTKVEVEPFLGQFVNEGLFVMPGDKDYDYQKFAKLQPLSRTSEEIKNFIYQKKISCKEDHFCRFENVIPPAKRKESVVRQLGARLYPPKKGSLISYLMSIPKPSL